MSDPADAVRIEAFRGRSEVEAPKVRERVISRLELLQLWSKDGVPQEYVGRVPTSQEEARVWNAPELGIFPIGSKSDFVTTHPLWGGDVREIRALMKSLEARYRPRRDRKSSRREASEARETADKLRILLARAASQWHLARESVERLSREHASIEAKYADLEERYEALLEKLSRREDELSSTRRQLAGLEGLARLRSS